MAGIYIHIPFCKKACYYCDFYFTTSKRLKGNFLTALKKEVFLRKQYLAPHDKVETIYFGGGTPSQFSGGEIGALIQQVKDNYPVAADVEVTVEANPDDLTPIFVKELKEAGVNRLSIGVQSFFNEHLQWMNRAHTANEAIEAIELAQTSGISNITLDLIYGIPGMTSFQWLKNLEQFFALNVPHLSAYSLTVEDKTPLDKLIRTGKYQGPSEGISAEHFELLMQVMDDKGWLHYEISNFASNEGMISRHNSAYWKNKPYVGLGPSAHSYNGSSRQWNVSQLQEYIDSLELGELRFEQEMIGDKERYNEKILTGLRTLWGVEVQELGAFGAHFIQESASYIKTQDIEIKDGRYLLTRKGKYIADTIASDLFVT